MWGEKRKSRRAAAGKTTDLKALRCQTSRSRAEQATEEEGGKCAGKARGRKGDGKEISTGHKARRDRDRGIEAIASNNNPPGQQEEEGGRKGSIDWAQGPPG